MIETIRLRVEYDRIDSLILDSLKYSDLTVNQLQAIISHKLQEDISSMIIYDKLTFLIFIGKVRKERKNVRVFKYSIV
jgi:hypothetical protein